MNRPMLRIAVIALFAASGWSQAYAARGAGLIHRKSSLYHDIFVYKRGAIVTLRFGMMADVVAQTQVDLGNPQRHMLEYTPMTFCGLLYAPEPNSILVIGLGGGVIPRQMRDYFPDAHIDVVEIDAEVLRIAKEYFDFVDDDRLKVHIEDGRMFVRKRIRDKGAKYDIVVLDAFNSDYIPYHLMTKEFLQQVKGVLSDKGVVVANVFYPNRLFPAEFATFLDVFADCQAYFGTRSGNAMLVGLGDALAPLTLRQAAAQSRMLQQKHRFSFNMLTVAKKLDPDARPEASVRVLTDDRAPVNYLRSQPRGRR